MLMQKAYHIACSTSSPQEENEEKINLTCWCIRMLKKTNGIKWNSIDYGSKYSSTRIKIPRKISTMEMDSRNEGETW